VAPRAPALEAALAARLPEPARDGTPAAAIVVFVGVPARPEERQRVLRDLQRRLPAGAPVLLVDHNQPRAWWRRVLAAPSVALPGLGLARARYPAARELAALGFRVERLGLGHGERIQLIVART
jgi:hypothetical protein